MTATLSEVCTITMGQAPTGDSYNDRGDGLPLIAGAGDFDGQALAPVKFTTKPGKVSKSGDIVLSIRASIGAKVWADGEYCLGRGVAGLRPGPLLDAKYLWHWLTRYERDLASKGRGATFLQVNKADIGKMPIELPPLPEQRRIAAILDRADALRTKRRQVLAHLDSLSQSIFNNMFRGGAWPTGPLAEVVRTGTLVTYGIVQAGPEFDDGVPYIRTGDIVGGQIIAAGLRHTDPAIAARFERSTVRAGDIVMSIRATVGTTAVVPPDLDGANLTQGTARIAPSEKAIGPYLLECLRSPAVQHWIQRQIKGATFREITLGRLRELEVPLPPMPRQEEFADRVDAVNKHRAVVHRALVADGELFASLQSRAFRSEF